MSDRIPRAEALAASVPITSSASNPASSRMEIPRASTTSLIVGELLHEVLGHRRARRLVRGVRPVAERRLGPVEDDRHAPRRTLSRSASSDDANPYTALTFRPFEVRRGFLMKAKCER